MKKLFLFMLAAGLVSFTFAQQSYQLQRQAVEHFAPANNLEVPNVTIPVQNVKVPEPDMASGTASKAVVIKTIGNAGNAFGLYGGSRTYLWADNDLNSAIFIHRMAATPGTGFLAYDVTTDNGETWEVDQQVWDPAVYPSGASNGNARYPQAAIYNPAGNTDPANAYVTFFAPALDATNGASWGGYAMGTNPLTAVNPTTPTAMGMSSAGGDVLQNVPDGFHVTSGGKAICYEPSVVEGLANQYTGYLLFTSGYYDEEMMMFDYSQELFDFDISGGGEGTYITATKLAFHPDGQVGYMAMLSNNGENDVAEGALYPILFKTENGGEDWDGPYTVQLGGPDGLPAVLNYLTDEFLEFAFAPPVPAREELLFSTTFDIDVAVDMNGNPHIFFCVALGSGEWSVYTGWEGLPGTGNSIALIHAASYDGMNSWYADTVNTPHTFRGDFPGASGSTISEDLRPTIATTPDGSKLFFSWITTDIPDVDDNIAPDIYCQGYRVADHAFTQVYNVTSFTDIMWQAWMGSGSYWVFDDGEGNYEIPFVSQLMDPDDNIEPVVFKYVDNFVITDEDFLFVSTPEVEQEVISISKNYPNPATNMTNVNITLKEAASVQLEISNLLGQKVKTVNYGQYTKGLHKISIDVSGLESGIYIYTLTTGNDAAAGKMIVE
ncbi:MAG: T9SS type A sorting domain-containing protein [Bacteroidales bacterium]|nr:T9SS type A sorting domain-containing protein [Bacteroidales bacterium]